MRVFLVVALTVMGCASSGRGRDPVATYYGWREAVERKDERTASSMMVDSPYPPTYGHATRGRVRHIRWHASMGGISWTWKDGRWVITSLPSFEFKNSTPLEAVRTFVRAIRYERWDYVLRILPSWISVRLTEGDVKRALSPSKPSVRTFLQKVEEALGNPMLVAGGGVYYFVYDEGKSLTLKREEDGWHVESPY